MNRAVLISTSLVALLSASLSLPAAQSAQAAAPRQQATLSVSPGITQNGAQVAAADDAGLLGTASFAPVRRGRLVMVQCRVGGEPWRTVVRRHEDAAGRVQFRRDDKRGRTPYSYRVVAPRAGALPGVVSNATSSRAWTLRFDEAFDGTSLDAARWSYRNVGLLRGTRMHAESSPQAVDVSNGALHLHVRRNPARPADPLPYFLNGHISTQDKFSYVYGYAAARMRFPQGQGQHGAFWMQPQSRLLAYGDPARTGAEIDVAESFGEGHRNNGIANYVYTYPDDGSTAKHGGLHATARRALQGKGDSWSSRYHVFSVLRTSTGYTFSIDGIETSRIVGWVSSRPEYLLLSLLSSDWELPDLDPRTLPTTMDVDWVRVWTP